MTKRAVMMAAIVAVVVAGWAEAASAQTLYAADGRRSYAGYLYEVNAGTGNWSVVGPIVDAAGNTYPIGGMVFDDNGVLWAVSHQSYQVGSLSSRLLKIDTDTGAATVVADISDNGIKDLAWDGTTLWGWSANAGCDCLTEIDTTDGSLTPDTSPQGTFGGGLEWDAANTRLVATLEGRNGDLDEVSTSDGSLTQIVALTGSTNNPVPALAIANGTLFGATASFNDTEGANLVSIDPGTGNITVISSLPPMVEALAAQN